MSERPAVRIRAAAREDAARVAAVLSVSFAGHRDSYAREAYAAAVLDAERIEQRLSEGTAWVASLGGEVVGTASASA